MRTSGLVLALFGILVLAQVLRGHALERLGVVPP